MNDGKCKKLGEQHMLIECEPMEQVRASTGLSGILNLEDMEHMNTHEKYKEFWTGDFSNETLSERIKMAKTMKEIFLEATMKILSKHE